MARFPRALKTHYFHQGSSQLTIAQQGAHLLSWAVDGAEQLYMSPAAVLDGTAPIRGGVPVCFPQFNMRGALPKHGFARTLPWALVADAPHPCFELTSSDTTRALWPFDFVTRLQFELSDQTLRMVWTVTNTGAELLAFTGALHTYLAVANIADTRLGGLQGQKEWDSVQDKTLATCRVVGSEPLMLTSEFDRVYTAPSADSPIRVLDGGRVLEITQSASLANTVVWNPHAELCAAIADLPTDGYEHMLCVEAAQVLSPITVPAGDTWTGWQQLCVLPFNTSILKG